MHTRTKEQQELFDSLVRIKDKINKQIPLAANRVEEFECIEIDPNLSDVQKEVIFEKVAERYAVHEKEFGIASTTHHIFTQLNLLFTDYLHTQQTARAGDLTLLERQAFMQWLPLQAQNIYRKIKRQQKYMPEIRCPDISQLDLFLQTHADVLVSTLLSGKPLKLQDADMALRMQMYDRLRETREIQQEQEVANLDVLSAFDTDVRTKLTKLSFLWRGLFLQREKASVGFCDEHKNLGLIHIFQGNKFFNPDKSATIEVISIRYTDEDDKENDGHTFLAINRDPSSTLHDIAGWGKHAILFDAWNKLVCYAEEFNTLPIHYFSFPDGAKWEVIATYTEKDRFLYLNITQLNHGYYITGNSETKKRAQRLKEAYQLISLEQPELKRTKKYLYQLARKMRPANFKYKVKLFLTTHGDNLISVIPGFSEPKIAVHTEAFKVCTEEELQFAMAQAVVTVQRCWAGMTKKIPTQTQHQIDKCAIEISRNGPAAISFLRKNMKHKENDSQTSSGVVYSLIYESDDIEGMSDADRIKAFSTLFALDEYHYLYVDIKDTNETAVSEKVCSEVGNVKPFVFFKAELEAIIGIAEKINYLTTQLSALEIELLPHESTHQSSIRVKHICSLLRSMHINLEDQVQLNAANRLITTAYHSQTPGFKDLYYAIHGLTEWDFTWENRDTCRLKPLGVFADLQTVITHFVQADSVSAAKEAAEKFQELYEKLTHHLSLDHCDYQYNERYFEKHGILPTGKDRVFCSNLGEKILWKGFEANDEYNLPWTKHVDFAREDKTNMVVHILWRLGVNNYQPLWSVFRTVDFVRLINNFWEARPFIFVGGLLTRNYTCDYRFSNEGELHTRMLRYLADQHQLNTSMFDQCTDFAEAFKQYYDANLPMLIYPSSYYQVNIDNHAVNFLLQQFTRIALSGSDGDKQVVKDFFFNPPNQRGLMQLSDYNDRHGCRGALDYNSLYIKFIFEREYNGTKFNLHLNRELIKFFAKYEYSSYVYVHIIPPLKYIEIYELPYNDLDICCLEQLIPLMVKDKFGNPDSCIRAHLNLLKPKAMSMHALRIVRLSKMIGDTIYHYPNSDDLDWVTSLNKQEKDEFKTDDMIYLYRYYNERSTFPSLEVKQQVAELVMKRYASIQFEDDKIKFLEELLLQTTFNFPLGDITLRNDAINLWVEVIVKKYGKDDGSNQYYKKLKAVIDRILKYGSNRDTEIILEKLAVRIESQWELSEHLGEQLEPEKYLYLDRKKSTDNVAYLARVSKYFSENTKDQHQLLDFLSAPLTNDSMNRFETYINQHKDVSDLYRKMGLTEQGAYLKLPFFLHMLYFQFWERSLEERAILIEYVLIPSTKVKTETEIRDAYNQGFDFISRKLLPNADDPASDDHFAHALIKAYLDTSNKFIRSIFLSGMLIATNEASQMGQVVTVGKKIAMMCEHMGPAYIKLAQAIHSHPRTPEHLRRDLAHIKGRANPPRRWQLWRLVTDVLVKGDRDNIQRLGRLLGSASYNLALEAELKDGSQVVLLMLRENAARDAKKGFKHLRKTVVTCQHPRLKSSREALLSIIREARSSSEIEMDKDKSELQYQLGDQLYSGIVKSVKPTFLHFAIHFTPAKLLKNGHGYRFISRVYGHEFNDLPTRTAYEQETKKAIAAAVIEVELVNLLRGAQFDSDRHGNQLRALVDLKNSTIELGLYDFGEMSLEPPKKIEIEQLIALIKSIPKKFKIDDNFSDALQELLSEHIDNALKAHQPTSYLMRLRKAVLALQDFQKELSTETMISIIKKVIKNESIHPKIRNALQSCATNMLFLYGAQSISRSFSSLFSKHKESSEIADDAKIQVKFNPTEGTI